MEDMMAWRDDKARSILIRDAAGSVQPGKAPRSFAELLFGYTNVEDLANHDAQSLAFLAEQAWEHVQQRTAGSADIRVVNPMMPDGREISVLEILNDNMPFLFDSTTAELAEQGIEVTLVAHPILAVERDSQGKLLRFHGEALPEGVNGTRESLIHLHITRLDADADRQKLIDGLTRTLNDVRACVTDWRAMRDRVEDAIKTFSSNPPPLPIDEVAEANQFLQWLCADNFTFLGVREYRFSPDSDASDDITTGKGLGVLRDPDAKVLRRGSEMVVMTSEIREFMHEPTLLIVIKANVSSRVHRRIRMDYVGIKLYTPDGRLEGELRVVGLFTSGAYTRSARQIPYVRHKVTRALQRAGFDPNGHSGKALMHILEEYPRDELFQVDVDTLYNFVMEILILYERPRVRALARVDKFDRFVSILTFIPREKYDTNVRTRVGAFLSQVYKGTLSASYVSFPEGALVRVHYIIGRYDGKTPVVERTTLEAGISAIAATWADKLKAALTASTDGMRARMLTNRYAQAFSGGYTEVFSAERAITDIATIEKLTPTRPVAISVYRDEGEADPKRFGLRVFSHGAPLSLSYRVPVIENHGLHVVNERTYQIAPRATPTPPPVWLHEMTIETSDGQPITISPEFSHRLEASIMAVVRDHAESDGYNGLILRTALGWREVSTIRALSRYLHQIRAPFTQDYMWETLRKNAAITASLVALFQTRLDPRLASTEAERSARETALLAEVEEQLKSVASLDEDRILRRFTNLVQATIRTNLWQIGEDGHPRPVISFKFDARRIDDLPAPRPLYEIFVYSPRVEGIHLRFGKVARGGLRWSDRPQDFRTEILGLVKAQQVKNAVIVPVGAKGGFVPKRLPPPSNRDAWLAEGTEAYRIFVRSLLELTDNLDGDIVVPPESTVRHDGDDPYLVVAADKGTATFSDIANAISAEKNHWLGDAFASGGSQGYDHKKMGITARGAWEAVKRHFRELGTDIQTMPFTAVGVGDMSGDVFGNGMLLSPATKLVAAFDHRDIFIDPSPDPAISLAERKRLFDLPRSSWQDYNKSLISAGGGVFSRQLKAIPLAPEVRTLLDLDKPQATPFEVMTAILKARADLLWFGGIGTYVRSAAESDDQAGDRANDPIRITGSDVRARVIGEGANLGVTQRGRIEAAQKGVKLNTDAIDNSAGVNTSDVEVNIKIALARLEREGRLSPADRNSLLAAMTDEVGTLVLRNNYLQSLALSLAERKGVAETGFLTRLMQSLEQRDLLSRTVEFLPDDAALTERTRRGQSLARPELAVLLAYAKLTLYDDLLVTSVPDDPYLARELSQYFPREVQDKYPRAVESHRLRREIIATSLANAVINRGGPACVVRLIDETDADIPTIVMAYVAVDECYGLKWLSDAIDALDTCIDGRVQLSLYASVQDLLLSRMVWYVRNVDFKDGLEAVVARFGPAIRQIVAGLDTALPPDLQAARAKRRQDLTDAGVPAGLAGELADLDALVPAPDIVTVAERTARPIGDAAATFFAAEANFRLDRIVAAARSVPANDYFERMAIDRAVEQIAGAERRLAADMLATGQSGQHAVETWLAAHPEATRIRRSVEEIAASGLTLAKLTVAANLLGDLVKA
ncbi:MULTISPECIES: NAD-glutamate dehydrogenase [unclassified Bradyrhizobium]|uniref:NAD-glutamate dehydrogenase n=1 Tax=unclassified Bradyrhizobium TaxID=2631580 RepID=UPI001BA46530|nr:MULTISPECIES: NAD-glutamate dehydrogenase [unclassified Bradyrhizobium]MBR1208508.1 NAD-glutamate dehydrogenase [Bradyrhizobium sp. AUGA SZCCT0124]MBR1312623.1 NAD-glutamate dehydrogenase [Bradyrhizobium sp. AUGA SZCCT0051]MBR1340981.1 NAD-glutamate dehydrogenase [Bradyrhizobium sp. AUGA SZCCT0105]MBR1359735.1 NAD-glutamate dehydrogenase [Bradyrhizobium sp. AUGA SZCCT0045]